MLCLSCEGDAADLPDLSGLFANSPPPAGSTAAIAGAVAVGGVDPEQCGFDGMIAEVSRAPPPSENNKQTNEQTNMLMGLMPHSSLCRWSPSTSR